jgi:mannose-1-phosphate guanylyltransferase
MRAVVLVGGFGTRLRPLTNHRPKQMLPIVNRPMIEHVVGHLAGYGVDDVVLSLGYRPDAFSAAYPDGRCAGATLHYAIEPEPLDTAGAIRFAVLDARIDERFLVLNGDVLTDLDIGAFLAFHESRGAEATIALHRVDDPSRYGVVPTDGEGRVIQFVEKPPRGEAPTDLINAGTYIFEPAVVDRIPDGRRVSVERETFPAMVADRSLYALDDGCYWIDTGTPCEYVQAQIDLVDGVRGAPVEGIHRSAEVSADASVKRAVVGAGAVIAAGARVEAAVLLAGAGIEADAVVDGSVIGERAVVGAGAHVTGGSIVGDGHVVARGERLDGARVPGE